MYACLRLSIITTLAVATVASGAGLLSLTFARPLPELSRVALFSGSPLQFMPPSDWYGYHDNEAVPILSRCDRVLFPSRWDAVVGITGLQVRSLCFEGGDGEGRSAKELLDTGQGDGQLHGVTSDRDGNMPAGSYHCERYAPQSQYFPEIRKITLVCTFATNGASPAQWARLTMLTDAMHEVADKEALYAILTSIH